MLPEEIKKKEKIVLYHTIPGSPVTLSSYHSLQGCFRHAVDQVTTRSANYCPFNGHLDIATNLVRPTKLYKPALPQQLAGVGRQGAFTEQVWALSLYN